MSSLVIVLILIVLTIFTPFLTRRAVDPAHSGSVVMGLRVLFVLGALVLFAGTSIVRIPANEVGIVRKIYGYSSLPEGRIIATKGETGYQAETIAPGTFKVSPFFNVLNNVETVPLVTIPNGFYGRIVTRDGKALDATQIMADAWPDAELNKYLDATYFLDHDGTKGLQLSVLKPGTYAMNLALYEVRVGRRANGRDVTDADDDVYDLRGRRTEKTPLDTSITSIPAGSVGVVRASVQTKGIDCRPATARTDDDGLSAELVPQGCKGVWSSSLNPGSYYLNRDAYDVTMVSTRVQALEFHGGYTKRSIDLQVDAKGNFQQHENVSQVPVDPNAADVAVNTKIEGWQVPQEIRAIVQVSPEHAPIVVAAVGGVQQIETQVIVPAIRSHVRNVFGGQITVTEPSDNGVVQPITRPTRVLDTVEHRTDLEQAILKLAAVDGRRAGVDVKEIRLGESAIPPELLLARQREQLAGQLKRAYEQEKVAQETRQATEQARATAEQQGDLVRAQIAVSTAELHEKERAADGRAERAYLEQQAAGQTAQANVLGRESVLKLQTIKIFTDLLEKQPGIVSGLHLPQTVVMTGGGGLGDAAAIFGALTGAKDSPPAR
jgi:hypothetical protein